MRAGDRVECVGIYKPQPQRLSKTKTAIRTHFNTYMDIISFRQKSKAKLDVDQKVLSEEAIAEMKRFAKRKDLYDVLIASLAPSIWENEDVKKGILCQLFGGTKKDFAKAGRSNFRNEINCLLVGDPSTAKSQILNYVHQIAPRGIYTSGKGSSAVGLTAYVTKDPET